MGRGGVCSRMLNAPAVERLTLDVNIYGVGADTKLRCQPCFGFGYGERLHARPGFRRWWVLGRDGRRLEFELFQFNLKLFQRRISDGITPRPLSLVGRNCEFANLEKPALLTSSVKAVLPHTADLAYQKSGPMAFRTRFRLPHTDEIFLPLHSFFCSYPGPGPAMGKELLKWFRGENRNGRVGQGNKLQRSG
jgi:hypothetical protein